MAKAVRLQEAGGHEFLKIEELEVLPPGKGDI
jgi:hypothetical protein